LFLEQLCAEHDHDRAEVGAAPRDGTTFVVLSFQREQSDAIARLTGFAKREMRSWSDGVPPLPAKDYQRRMADRPLTSRGSRCSELELRAVEPIANDQELMIRVVPIVAHEYSHCMVDVGMCMQPWLAKLLFSLFGPNADGGSHGALCRKNPPAANSIAYCAFSGA
jgi:hypothetical protein